jgi:hypothetical protein
MIALEFQSQDLLAWVIASSIISVLTVAFVYRFITRTFDKGPRDT